MTAAIAGAFDQVCARRHPAPSTDADLHELFEQETEIDTDHPDYAELFAQWAAERGADIADRWAS